MQFTTPTEIARKGSKIFFEYDEAIVMKNNKNIGLLFGGELAQALLESDIVRQIREELWEINDAETVNSISEYRTGDTSDSISFEAFRKKHGV